LDEFKMKKRFYPYVKNSIKELDSEYISQIVRHKWVYSFHVLT
jgi:hypothetical protein